KLGKALRAVIRRRQMRTSMRWPPKTNVRTVSPTFNSIERRSGAIIREPFANSNAKVRWASRHIN
ncbi:MAG: hypothetical protein WA660_14570, partial [Candidatus Acidiferrales bacterium]